MADFQPTNNRKTKKSYPKELFDDRMGRMPPHSTELEEAVLGAMMLDREKINNVIDILTEKHFYHPQNQVIYSAIKFLYEAANTVDLFTVSNYLKNEGKLEVAGGNIYLAQLTNKVSSAANIEFHSRILTQKFIQRSLIQVAGEIQFDAYDDAMDSFELLDKSESKLYDIKDKGLKRNYQEISELIATSLKDIEAKMSNENEGITGVASGFTDLDRVNGGWQPSDLVILAARPAMGKTAFALSLLRNAAVDHKKSVMIFSLEMSDIQLVNRLISAEAQVEGDKIKKGNLVADELSRLQQETTALQEARIFIDDTPQLNIFDLNAKCRRVHSQHGLDMVIVDYLQLLRHETKGAGNREQEIAFISRSLKALAKDLNIPVIALAQLSREVEKRGNKRPQLSDLRESGSIEQDADMVMFLYRHEYYEKMGMDTNESAGNTGGEEELNYGINGLTEVIIGKNRHGSVGSAFCKFVGQFSKFQDLTSYEREQIRVHKSDYNANPNPSVTLETRSSKLNEDDFNNGSSGDSSGGGNDWNAGFSRPDPNVFED